MNNIPIAIINQAKTPLGCDLTQLVSALQKYADDYLRPVWQVSCRLYTATAIPKQAWYMVLLDDADQANALGYHDVVAGVNAQPYSRIFVKTAQANGELTSVVAAHELGEMLVDPLANQYVMDGKGNLWPKEIADACEEDTFLINNLPMPNFVFPEWFDFTKPPNSGRVDLMGLMSKSFEIRPGGYGSIIVGGQWQDVFGSQAKQERFAKEDRRGHRSELRVASTVKALR